jgi:glutamate-1-semialdehyde 2,1-aminomutase
MTYSDRLNNVIPGGAHTYSRGDDQFPSTAPQILTRGEGAYVWDPDGRRFLDYGMGLRAVTLGYANARVNAAALRQIENGVNLTRPSTVELEAAETLAELIPSADMVKFGKNGSNVTTGAVKLARAFTGRRYVCIPRQQPFFSFDDWFIGVTNVTRGIPAEHASLTLVFDYGDIASLEQLFQQHPGDIACVMMEPSALIAGGEDRAGTFLAETRTLTKKHGALLILDEMITGFRYHLRGAQTYYDIAPDLSTFGKGMANGFSLSALVGRRDIMELGGIRNEGAERVFMMSTTHGSEMPPLGAFIETIRVYRDENVIGHLWNFGQRLFDGLRTLSDQMGLGKYFDVEGNPTNMNYVTRDCDGAMSLPMRTLFVQEMARHGVLIPWVAVSLSHGDEELALTLSAAEKAFAVYQRALDDGWQKYLVGSPIKPVFRRTN